MSFADFHLDPKILAAVRDAGFQTPTPIQKQAIPAALAGSDLLGLSQTGTGKTAAFALPILQRLITGPRKRLRALIVAPTRELADQIGATFTLLGRQTGLHVAVLYGGVSQKPQVDALKRGAEIVVACPGRLLDLVEQGLADLGTTDVLVLDEADQMFDMGFLPQVRKIVKLTPAGRQSMLFSATMPPEIETLVAEILTSPRTIRAGGGATPETISHRLYPVAKHLKTALLHEVVEKNPQGSILVFAKTKHRARRLAELLKKAGHAATQLQGNMSQNRRQEAMDGFRDGTFRIMVATDIAARGIDVSLVQLVINYDLSDTAEYLIHRIGRTGRASRSGHAVTFVAPEDEPMIKQLEKLLGQPVKRAQLAGFDYSVPDPRVDEFKRHPHELGGASPRSAKAASPKPAAPKPAAPKPAAPKPGTPKPVAPSSAVGGGGSPEPAGKPGRSRRRRRRPPRR